jgi:hypothetical protein
MVSLRFGDLPLVHIRDESVLTAAGTSHHRRLHVRVVRRGLAVVDVSVGPQSALRPR